MTQGHLGRPGPLRRGPRGSVQNVQLRSLLWCQGPVPSHNPEGLLPLGHHGLPRGLWRAQAQGEFFAGRIQCLEKQNKFGC